MDKNSLDKTSQLILYVCKKLADDQSFGSVKLNKALYYIDNGHYLKYGSPISIFSYVKQAKGPTPKPSEFMPLREEMINSRSLEIIETELFPGMKRKRPHNLIEPNLDLFSKDEIVYIDSILSGIKKYSAWAISEDSHQELSWIIAENGEELPYYTFLLTESDITDKDIKLAYAWMEEYQSTKAA